MQPTGVQVPGPRGAVMPNTGTGMPANPAPTTTNVRQDEKPLPVSMREGASVPVRTATQKNADKQNDGKDGAAGKVKINRKKK